MNAKLAELKSNMNEIYNISKSPRLYLINYYEELIRQVDLECTCRVKLTDDVLINPELIHQDKHELLEELHILYNHHADIVDTIKQFESQCYTNLDLNQSTISKSIQNSIDAMERGLNELKTNSSVEILIGETLHDIRRLLFLNRTVLFIQRDEIPEFYLTLNTTLVGLLIFVEDEHLTMKSIEHIK